MQARLSLRWLLIKIMVYDQFVDFLMRLRHLRKRTGGKEQKEIRKAVIEPTACVEKVGSEQFSHQPLKTRYFVIYTMYIVYITKDVDWHASNLYNPSKDKIFFPLKITL